MTLPERSEQTKQSAVKITQAFFIIVRRIHINTNFTGKIQIYAIPDFKYYLQCQRWCYI